MKWHNEPGNWNLENNKLIVNVPPKTDYWQITHYGFIADNGPFYYTEIEGEFEVRVKITGEYNSLYDQMGLMFRIDEKNWIKTGIEYVNEVYNYSTVTTREFSNWSVNILNSNPKSI